MSFKRVVLNVIIISFTLLMTGCCMEEFPEIWNNCPPDKDKIVGEWKGTYTCNQGLTGLTLTIKDNKDKDVEATFSFYAVESNPDVPSGSYRMKGEYEKELKLSLKGISWIDKPSGYKLVDLDGKFNANYTTYSGKVKGSSNCTIFNLSKQKSSINNNEPFIRLNGDNPLTLTVGTSYVEQGARAIDKEGEEVKVTIIGNVDSSKIGTYIITYIAIDSDNNKVIKTREVNVIENKTEDKESLKITKIKNTVLNLDYICRVGDKIEIIGSNLSKDNISLNFLETNGTVIKAEASDIRDEAINFECPNLSEGYREFYLGYNDKNSSFYNIQFIKNSTPIIDKLSLDSNILTIEGKNLKQFFTLHINQQTIDVNNTQGNGDIIDDIEIPKNVTSGYVYLDNNLTQSNSIYLTLKVEKNGKIVSPNTSIDLTKIVIWSQGNEVSPDSNGIFDIKLNRNTYNIVFSSFMQNSKDIIYLFTVAIDDDIVLDSLNSAISFVWMRLNIDENLGIDKLKEIKKKISKIDEINKLSTFIDNNLKSNPYFFKTFDDGLKERIKIATLACNKIINLENTVSNKINLTQNKATIIPHVKDDIRLYENPDGSGNLILKNSTTLPLSVKIEDMQGNILRKHISSYFALGAINPKFLYIVSNNEVFDVPQGKDCKVEVLTPGWIKDSSTLSKTQLKIITSLRRKYYNDLMGKTINKQILGKYLDVYYSIFAPDIPNFKGAWKNFYQTFLTDAINPEGIFKEKLEKKFGKNIIKKASKGFKYLLVFELVDTFTDRIFTNSLINFKVKFPNNIREIEPNEISILDRSNSYFYFKLKGNNLEKYADGGIVEVFDKDETNELLISGDIVKVNSEGTEIEIKIDKDSLKEYFILNHTSINLIFISIRLNNINDLSQKSNTIILTLNNDIKLISIEPKEAKVGDIITLKGYGFIPKNEGSTHINIGEIGDISGREIFDITIGEYSEPDSITFKLLDISTYLNSGSYKVSMVNSVGTLSNTIELKINNQEIASCILIDSTEGLMWSNSEGREQECTETLQKYKNWRTPSIDELVSALKLHFNNLVDGTYYLSNESRELMTQTAVRAVRFPDGRVTSLGMAYARVPYTTRMVRTIND